MWALAVEQANDTTWGAGENEHETSLIDERDHDNPSSWSRHPIVNRDRNQDLPVGVTKLSRHFRYGTDAIGVEIITKSGALRLIMSQLNLLHRED